MARAIERRRRRKEERGGGRESNREEERGERNHASRTEINFHRVPRVEKFSNNNRNINYEDGAAITKPRGVAAGGGEEEEEKIHRGA